MMQGSFSFIFMQYAYMTHPILRVISERTVLNGRLMLPMANVISCIRPSLRQGHCSKKDVTGELLQGTRSKRKRLFSMAVPLSVMRAPGALRCTDQHENRFLMTLSLRNKSTEKYWMLMSRHANTFLIECSELPYKNVRGKNK